MEKEINSKAVELSAKIEEVKEKIEHSVASKKELYQ